MPFSFCSGLSCPKGGFRARDCSLFSAWKVAHEGFQAMLWAESGQESPCSVLKEDWKGCFGADECLLEGYGWVPQGPLCSRYLYWCFRGLMFSPVSCCSPDLLPSVLALLVLKGLSLTQKDPCVLADFGVASCPPQISSFSRTDFYPSSRSTFTLFFFWNKVSLCRPG